MSSTKKTDYRFKVLYTIGILMIVCSHFQGGSISFELGKWFPYGGLHVVLFVFGSGYFYKKEAEQHVCGYIWKKCKKLVIPLYLYNFAYGALVWISRFKGFEIGEDPTWYHLLISPITSGHQFMYHLAGWFVAPLFMVQILYVVLRKLLSLVKADLPEWVIFLCGLLLGLAGSQLACMGKNTGWWLVLVRMLYFMPFYSLGCFYRNSLEKYDKRIPSSLYLAVIFLLKLIIICCMGRSPEYVLSWCDNFTDGPVLPIAVGMLGIAFWFRIAGILAPVIGESKWINKIADNSYSIMMNQFLGMMLLKTVFAVGTKVPGITTNFDFQAYKTDIWWMYLPGGIEQIKILYVVAGIAVPILIQSALDRAKKFLPIYHENKKNDKGEEDK